MDYSMYNQNNVRATAYRLAKKYKDLSEQHIYWITKELNIYPDAVPYKKSKKCDMAKMGKINRDNTSYVQKGRLSDDGIQAIESYLVQEGYEVDNERKEETQAPKQNTNIWEQADLISLMKKDYEKAVAERNEARAEAEQYLELADKYEKEIEDLKDRLLISEKENCSLKSEKQELSKMQIKTVDFSKEIDELQTRIGKYNQEINLMLADMNVLRKDYSMLQTRMNQMQDNKKKLDGVLSDLVGCSKRLINLK